MRVLLTVAYDGTNYSGWQRQRNAVTIQQTIEDSALSTVFGRAVSSTGASRTDTGVHALTQKVSFEIDESELFLPLEKLPVVLNRLLPKDIVINRAELVGDNFHPAFSAKHKSYEYKIQNAPYPNPLLINCSEFVRYPLDFAAMSEAARYFIGEHDFSAFRASNGSAKTTVRTIYSLDLRRDGNIISFVICGNGFLYNMVRIIAGTLIYIGLGKIEPACIPEIIASKDRAKAGKTASACGLTLIDVRY